MAVNNLLKFVLHWSGYNEEGTITMHLAPVAAAYDATDLLAALTAINTSMTSATSPSTWTKLRALMFTGHKFDRLQMYQYAVDNAPATSQAELVVNQVGTGVANGTPLQCAIVASLRTGIPGRSNRGRSYVPCSAFGAAPADAQASQAVIDAVGNAYTSLLGDVRDASRTALADDPIRFVVYSRVLRSSHEVTQVLVDSRFDVQRRRAASQVPARVNNYNAVSV